MEYPELTVGLLPGSEVVEPLQGGEGVSLGVQELGGGVLGEQPRVVSQLQPVTRPHHDAVARARQTVHAQYCD